MKRIAVTFTHGHSTYLDKWKEYYSKYHDEVTVYDLTGQYSTRWDPWTPVFNQLQDNLFKSYDYVTITDVDEFIVPDPDKYKDLGEYLDKNTKDTCRCLGYNVIEMEGQKQLDLTRPVLEQRTHWQYDPLYNKSVILSKPTTLINPHEIEFPVEPDKELIMFHLRDADPTSAKERCKKVGHKYDNQAFIQRREQAVKIPKKYINQCYV